MSRRNMLKGIGIAGAAIAVSPAVLAACGDDSGSSAATTAGGGGGAATTAAGGAATTGGAASGDVGATLAKLLEIDAATSGAGMDFKMGNVLALTGSGSFYGKTMTPRHSTSPSSTSRRPAARTINVNYYDHKSGDAAAGKQAITELGEAGTRPSSRRTSTTSARCSTAPPSTRSSRSTAAAAPASFGQGQPYFWGTRAITPNDPLPGLFKWTKETYPDAKTVGLDRLGHRRAEQQHHQGRHPEEDRRRRLRATTASTSSCPVGNQDFSPVLPEDQGQRARHPARRRLRPGPRLVRQPVGRPPA